MPQPPSGTVTFLLTDVEASAQAWQSDPKVAAAALRRQEEILAAAVAAHGGFRPVEQGEGDSVVAAFERASDAVAAALTAPGAGRPGRGRFTHPPATGPCGLERM